MKKHISQLCGIALVGLLLGGCSWSSQPVKKHFVLNYVPSERTQRLYPSPYPYIVRLKDFDVEDAYSRYQIVYRQSPFQLQYYNYKVWAVKPGRMITDLVQKHLLATSMISHVVRRFDEAGKPDYELTGMVEALEEYDSDKLWFAHMALWIRLTRLSDGKTIYARHFDNRKQVYTNDPENVVKTMSEIMEFIMNQASIDMDKIFAHEMGVATSPIDTTAVQ